MKITKRPDGTETVTVPARDLFKQILKEAALQLVARGIHKVYTIFGGRR